MPLYQTVNRLEVSLLSPKILRKVMQDMPEEEQEILERQGKTIVKAIRKRGGRFGEAGSDELLAKLGMFLIAMEQDPPIKMHYPTGLRKLLDAVE